MMRLVKSSQMQTSLPPPIPNPHKTPVQRVKQKGEMFRLRLLPTLLGMVVINLIVWYVILYPALSVAASQARAFKQITDSLVFTLLGSVIVAVITYLSFCMRATEGSLHGQNVWGIPAVVAWDEITQVQPVNFCGLKYLKISTATQRNVLWLPLYLKNMPKFKSLVALYTTPDNPLAKALAETR